MVELVGEGSVINRATNSSPYHEPMRLVMTIMMLFVVAIMLMMMMVTILSCTAGLAT